MNNTRAKIVICIFLAVATFSVYLQVKDHEFIDYDDKALISQNWNIKSGLSEEAIFHYKIAVKLKPDYAEVNNNLKKFLIN